MYIPPQFFSPKASCCSQIPHFPVITFACTMQQLWLLFLTSLTFFFFLAATFRSLSFSGRQTGKLLFYCWSSYHQQLFPSVSSTRHLMSSVTESPWNKLPCSTIICKERWLTQKIAVLKNHNSVYIVFITAVFFSLSLLFSGYLFSITCGSTCAEIFKMQLYKHTQATTTIKVCSQSC